MQVLAKARVVAAKVVAHAAGKAAAHRAAHKANVCVEHIVDERKVATTMTSEWNEPGTGAAWPGNQFQWDDAYEALPSFSSTAGETPDQLSSPSTMIAAPSYGTRQDDFDEPEAVGGLWQ